MRNPRKNLLNIIKTLVVVVAVGNLAALFLFGYRMPSFLTSALHLSSSGSDTESSASLLASDADAWEIQFPSDPLVYDGTTPLDLTADVRLVDAKEQPQESAPISATLIPGETINAKTIQYSAATSTGTQITALRGLQLPEDYKGPSIELNDEIPVFTEEQLADPLTALRAAQLLRGDDGFGNLITDQITLSDLSEPDEAGNITATLQVSNMLNDTFSLPITIPTKEAEESGETEGASS